MYIILRSNSRHLKRKVEKIDVYKLVPVPVDLNKLSDVVKKLILLKKMYIILRSNSRHLKRKVEKIDVYKLVPVPVDLNKLSDVVKKWYC